VKLLVTDKADGRVRRLSPECMAGFDLRQYRAIPHRRVSPASMVAASTDLLALREHSRRQSPFRVIAVMTAPKERRGLTLPS
jgi:hypothetical protein